MTKLIESKESITNLITIGGYNDLIFKMKPIIII